MADAITNEWAPGRLQPESALPETSLLLGKAALAEIEKIKSGIWQQMADLKGKKEKALWLEHCLTSCSILSRQLQDYEKHRQPATAENQIQTYRAECAKLQDQLLELIFFMQLHWPKYISKHLPLPLSAQQKVNAEIEDITMLLQKIAGNPGMDPHPWLLLINLMKGYRGEAENGAFTMRQWRYLGMLKSETGKCLHAAQQSPDEAFTAFIVKTNMNDIELAEQVMQTCRLSVMQSDNPSHQLQLWFACKNKFMYCVSAQKEGWHAGLPSFKNIITTLIKDEIKQIRHYTFIPGTTRNNPLPVHADPVKVNCSVEALGLFISLLQDADLLKCKNKTSLVSRIADACQTLNATNISAASLLNKSYKPGAASTATVHEALIRMVNLLRKNKT